MEKEATRPPIMARIVAGLVFLLGVLLVAATFYMALMMFKDPQAGVFPPLEQGQPVPELGTRVVIVVVRVVLLFIMAYAGSTIAGKGVALYEATRRHVVGT